MIQRDYLVVGAGVAAASACESIRQYDKKGSVTLVGNEWLLPYHRQKLASDFLTSAKPDADSLLYLPAEWYTKHKIELRQGSILTQLNLERKLAVFATGQTIEFRKALLAMGARPRKPKVAGASLGNILYLRTYRDALAIREMVQTEKNIIVIGGGIIAAEVTAALLKLGCKVTLMSRDSQLWQNRIDHDTAKWLTSYFELKGANLMLQETLNGFEGKTVLRNIQTKSGERFPASVAIAALGTDLNLGVVQNTPLSSPNGTPVTATMETEEKGIFAAGDIALHPDAILGGVRRSPYPMNAIEQGTIAGANMTGKKRQKYAGIPHFFANLFDLKFEFIGDFSLAPQTYEIEGEHAKRKFQARYFRGDKLTGVLLCNQSPAESEKALAQVTSGFKR